MKRVLKTGGLLILILLIVTGLAVGGLCLYSRNLTVSPQSQSISNTTGLVQAQGRFLYDADGALLQRKGINAGQILLQEGWMRPFALEPLKNVDGSYIKDADGKDSVSGIHRGAVSQRPSKQPQFKGV